MAGMSCERYRSQLAVSASYKEVSFFYLESESSDGQNCMTGPAPGDTAELSQTWTGNCSETWSRSITGKFRKF